MLKLKLICHAVEWSLLCLKSHFLDIVCISEPLSVSVVSQPRIRFVCIRKQNIGKIKIVSKVTGV